jgi:hypothetical protein
MTHSNLKVEVHSHPGRPARHLFPGKISKTKCSLACYGGVRAG